MFVPITNIFPIVCLLTLSAHTGSDRPSPFLNVAAFGNVTKCEAETGGGKNLFVPTIGSPFDSLSALTTAEQQSLKASGWVHETQYVNSVRKVRRWKKTKCK